MGFVGVEAAKCRLIEECDVPYITSLGRKGGTAVTAAVLNALLELAGGGPPLPGRSSLRRLIGDAGAGLGAG